jgi:HK97 family phage major capsid protein
MVEFLRQQLEELLTKRAALKVDLDKVLEKPSAEKRDMTAEEGAAFNEKRDAIKAADDEIKVVEARISELEEIEERGQRAEEIRQRQGGGVTVTREPLTYERGNGASYFLDLANAQFKGDTEARERLQRHGREMDVELPRRDKRREEKAYQEMRGISDLPEQFRESAFERRTNPNRTDGQGGYFVPPVWLIDEYIDLPRFGRQAANLCRGFTLPSGTDSINLPKVSTGTATAVQTADGAAVNSQDITDTFVNAGVKTIAGQQDIAMQLLDQSPISFDEVIFADLIADLNQKLDLQVINGSGSGNQATGILNVSGINAITYTDGAPTLPAMYVPIVKSASQVYKNRKMPAQSVLMIPSLWYWAAAQLDTTNRPLIVPPGIAFNAAGVQSGLAEEGPVGMLSFGAPVYADGNIPTNLGGGTNESRIITARWSDLFLWEGAMRTRVLSEVLSGTLQIRFQVYEYFAFMGNRRPEAISVVSGTGVIPAAGY